MWVSSVFDNARQNKMGGASGRVRGAQTRAESNAASVDVPPSVRPVQPLLKEAGTKLCDEAAKPEPQADVAAPGKARATGGGAGGIGRVVDAEYPAADEG